MAINIPSQIQFFLFYILVQYGFNPIFDRFISQLDSIWISLVIVMINVIAKKLYYNYKKEVKELPHIDMIGINRISDLRSLTSEIEKSENSFEISFHSSGVKIKK